MDSRRAIWYGTLTFSVLLEVWVRYALPLIVGRDGFAIWPSVDNIMHLFWGLNIFLFFVLVLRWKPIEGVLGVYTWQMGWEFTEMVGDVVQAQPVHMLDHFFFDGIKDTFVDIAGALLGWFFISRTKEGFADDNEHPRLRKAVLTHLALMLPLIPIGSILLLTYGKSPDLLAAGWIVGATPATYLIMRLTAEKHHSPKKRKRR
ncbi:TPA: hypothetical protein HA251_01900 [Candidatus Woesearchaeota archaeon]|nr:hypothetical protein [Candidatus Woesearchaeota archaeon]